MRFKYTLPAHWINHVAQMEEFANGATQVTIITENGKVYHKILISNSKWITAMRGYDNLPFPIDQIKDIYQTEEDKRPAVRGNWKFWDDWGNP